MQPNSIFIDWVVVDGLPVADRRAVLIRAVQEYLKAGQINADNPKSTHALMQALCPVGSVPRLVRSRLVTLLLSIAQTDLKDWATRASPTLRKTFGRSAYVRPWLWHVPGRTNADCSALQARVAELEAQITVMHEDAAGKDI